MQTPVRPGTWQRAAISSGKVYNGTAESIDSAVGVCTYLSLVWELDFWLLVIIGGAGEFSSQNYEFSGMNYYFTESGCMSERIRHRYERTSLYS